MKKNNNRSNKNLIKISEVLPEVIEAMNIDKHLKVQALREAWKLISEEKIFSQSDPAYFDKQNNLVIVANSSAVATELSMHKLDILSKLKGYTKDSDIQIKNIRFVVRS